MQSLIENGDTYTSNYAKIIDTTNRTARWFPEQFLQPISEEYTDGSETETLS